MSNKNQTGNRNCIFCQIVQGKMPCHEIYQDQHYLAFLSIFPNTQGFSVVIPKKHYPSYAFALEDRVLCGLVKATKKVGLLLDKAFDDVGRTGLIFEGFGVDHIHAKLFPMHGTKTDAWKKLAQPLNKYFQQYPGYISSHDYQRADDQKLAKLAKKIKALA
ncbi:MAG: HIT domain-containing protein [Candidatus Moranbacteria bacterium]|nr:HIT domain-containing protein [Candidatus Moranbacteria bacterium]